MVILRRKLRTLPNTLDKLGYQPISPPQENDIFSTFLVPHSTSHLDNQSQAMKESDNGKCSLDFFPANKVRMVNWRRKMPSGWCAMWHTMKQIFSLLKCSLNLWKLAVEHFSTRILL